jgi:hypothetical protein
MDSFETTLFLDKAESTRKAYLGNLRRLNNGKEIKNVNFLKDTKKNLEYVETVENPSTKKNYFISSVALLEGNKKMKKYYDIYHKQMMELNKKLTKDPFKSEKTLEKVAIPFEKLVERQQSLYKQIDYKWKKSEVSKAILDLLQDTIITSLYTLILPRRNLDFTAMLVQEPKDDNYNYYHAFKMYFNKYKTNKVYGQQIIDIPDELGRLIELRQRLSPSEWLLTNQKGNKLSTSMMSKAVSKAFGFDVGSSAIRNITATEIFGGQKEKMKQVATEMGTSVNMIASVYTNN